MVRRQRVALKLSAILLLSFACGKSQTPANRAAAGPQVRARVINIQITTTPDNGRFAAAVAISPDDVVRLTDEIDRYRLFDMKQKQITWVDTISRTYRVESFDDALRARRDLIESGNPSAPALKLAETGQTRTISGHSARQIVLTLGAYKRELWLSTDTLTPEPLLATILATDPVAAGFASTYRDVLGRLTALTGFPLQDRSEMPFRDKLMTIERTVTSIQEKNVPAALFTLPDDLQEVKPPVRAPVRRPRPSPPGRTQPAPVPPPATTVTETAAPTDTTATTATTATTGTTTEKKQVEEKKPEVSKEPAKKEPAVKKAPTKKAPTKKAPAKKAPTKKPPAKKAPATTTTSNG